MAAIDMLDTVSIRMEWPLKIPLPQRRKLVLQRGLRVWTSDLAESLERMEASLPTVLFGHNGRVLENQQQIDAALNNCGSIIAEIAEVSDIGECIPYRADIAWNFDLEAKPLILAHASLRVRGIQRGATLYNGGEGASFRGSRSQFVVTMYDKCREMRVPGSVLRVEISLRGDKLRQQLPGNDWQSFDALRTVFCEVLGTIPPITGAAKVMSLPEAVGYEPLEVRQRIMARLAHLPPRTFRRLNKRVEAAAAHLGEMFCWTDQLMNGLPPAVHVDRKRFATRNGVSPYSTEGAETVRHSNAIKRREA